MIIMLRALIQNSPFHKLYAHKNADQTIFLE
jgi:hypothetical protein